MDLLQMANQGRFHSRGDHKAVGQPIPSYDFGLVG